MVKRYDGSIYLFAVGMRNTGTRATFAMSGMAERAGAEVLGEGRRIALDHGRFEDEFRPFDVHIYRVRP